MADKIAKSFRLSHQAVAMLLKLSEYLGINQVAVLEGLIRAAMKENGLTLDLPVIKVVGTPEEITAYYHESQARVIHDKSGEEYEIMGDSALRAKGEFKTAAHPMTGQIIGPPEWAETERSGDQADDLRAALAAEETVIDTFSPPALEDAQFDELEHLSVPDKDEIVRAARASNDKKGRRTKGNKLSDAEIIARAKGEASPSGDETFMATDEAIREIFGRGGNALGLAKLAAASGVTLPQGNRISKWTVNFLRQTYLKEKKGG